jgi:hypothetical protein
LPQESGNIILEFDDARTFDMASVRLQAQMRRSFVADGASAAFAHMKNNFGVPARGDRFV